MASFEGKVALVTGGGGGIGRATSVLFGKNGARVVIADIDEASGEAAARAVAEAGGEALFVKADVTSPPDVEALVKRTVDTCGRLDCAFNNAGISRHQVPGGIAGWDEMVGVNLRGVMLCMRYEIPQMLQQGAGAIVNTSSVNALVTTRPSPARPPSPPSTEGAEVTSYGPSKAAILQMTRDAAVAYGSSGVRVNAVCPGLIDTPMSRSAVEGRPEALEHLIGLTVLRRIGRPEEVAEAVVWLCSDAASLVTGVALPVDGGWSIM